METKTLLAGIIGFFMGGLLVSVAAVTFDAPSTDMKEITTQMEAKTGDEYDQVFIANMIEHHKSAIDMARLSSDRAEHNEIQQLSAEIIDTQQAEIDQMQQWQREWNYPMYAPGHEMSH